MRKNLNFEDDLLRSNDLYDAGLVILNALMERNADPHRIPLFLIQSHCFEVIKILEICGHQAKILWEGPTCQLAYLVIEGHGLLTYGLNHVIITANEAKIRFDEYVAPTLSRAKNKTLDELILDFKKITNSKRYPF